MRLIDTHCHFDAEEFIHDREAILSAMQQQGVSDLILPAVSAASWLKVKRLGEQYPQCHASYGLHPMYLPEHRAAHLQQLRTWLSQEQAVAVGECGLDFFMPDLDPYQQEHIFIEQLRLACDFDLPVIIHARKALDTVLKHVRRFPTCRGVVHSFVGSQQQADLLIKQDFYLGLGGALTYERAQRLRKVASQVPLERIVLETDAPDQPDSAWRGKRNVPARLTVIAATLATLRNISIETVACMTTHNAQKLFTLGE